MEQKALHELLKQLHDQKLTVAEAANQLKSFAFEDMGFAKVDHHRALRKGYPEIIFCQNKAPDHIIKIVRHQIEHGETVFGTRAQADILLRLQQEIEGVEVNALARCFWKKSAHWHAKTAVKGTIVIASAGTADAPVSEEARCTVEILGHPCKAINDVGVAGIHRLFSHREDFDKAAVVIAIAGMEGALPSVIAGLVACPVIGVPTSVGYGSHLNGMVPLFAMLNSCASGLTVVNIDNGFGAGFAAALMNTLPGK
ncbi:MAG: nickel pincer cofactor biosynthesis protein LarB [Chitinivibrionales bacterium]|nr:nickel pincer cofactor biosynthesis protein LarB [Chitinivibrionales bacterium]